MVYEHRSSAEEQSSGLSNDGASGLEWQRAWAGRANVTVPHRANRLVLFDSGLYHRSDSLRFKPGYANRRINLTLLFGLPDTPAPGSSR